MNTGDNGSTGDTGDNGDTGGTGDNGDTELNLIPAVKVLPHIKPGRKHFRVAFYSPIPPTVSC